MKLRHSVAVKRPSATAISVADVVEGPGTRRAEERFQFGEGQFDRIEVGTVGRQKAELGADRFDRGAHRGLFVDGEVVEDDDIARAQRRDQDLLDVGEERRRVDRAVEDGRRAEAVEAQRRDDGVRLPVAARACDRGGACRRDSGRSAAADRSSRRIHRGRRTGACRAAAATSATGGAPRRHQAGVVRRRVPFFLTVKPKRSIVRHSVLRAAVVGNASRNSVNVASGRASDQRRQPLLFAGGQGRGAETSFASGARAIRSRGAAESVDAPTPD